MVRKERFISLNASGKDGLSGGDKHLGSVE